MTKWLAWSWWSYVLDRDLHGGDSYWTVVRCRLKGHPHGEIYYNPGGLEPDHHCRDCHEVIA